MSSTAVTACPPRRRRRDLGKLIIAASLIAGLLVASGFASAPPARAAAGDPDPTLLPVATTAQAPLTAAYDALNVPSIPAGGTYRDPTTNVRIYKLTSGTFPAASPTWNHDYTEGGNEVSLPYNGDTRAVLLRANDFGYYLADFTPGAGVSNPRKLTGPQEPGTDLHFTFSSNPATPYYAYVSKFDTIRRFDIRTMTEAPGGGWPVTDVDPIWLQQSENDGMFAWKQTAGGDTMVAYDPATGVKKSFTLSDFDEPKIDRAGRYVALTRGNNALAVWDWNTGDVTWTHPGDPGIPFGHVASLKRRWMGVDWNMRFPGEFTMFTADVPNSATRVGGPANSDLTHGSGNWIQNPADLDDQWALFTSYGGIRPDPTWAWLAPGGMIYVTSNGQRRLLAHPYNTNLEYTYNTFAKPTSDGHYVLFTSDMNGSGRSDVFLAEVPVAG
jgi:hypothetical protein